MIEARDWVCQTRYDDEINLYKNCLGFCGMIRLIESRVEGFIRNSMNTVIEMNVHSKYNLKFYAYAYMYIFVLNLADK